MYAVSTSEQLQKNIAGGRASIFTYLWTYVTHSLYLETFATRIHNLYVSVSVSERESVSVRVRVSTLLISNSFHLFTHISLPTEEKGYRNT